MPSPSPTRQLEQMQNEAVALRLEVQKQMSHGGSPALAWRASQELKLLKAKMEKAPSRLRQRAP